MYKQVDTYSKTVIVVDHDDATSDLIAELLKSAGLAPLCCAAWLLSAGFIEQTQAELMILDLGLGDPSAALDLIGELRQNPQTHPVPVIVCSTNERQLKRLAEPLRDLGCVALAKPFELDDFFSSIRECLVSSGRSIQRLAC
jgi:DNA-binding response OmpR family regulator